MSQGAYDRPAASSTDPRAAQTTPTRPPGRRTRTESLRGAGRSAAAGSAGSGASPAAGGGDEVWVDSVGSLDQTRAALGQRIRGQAEALSALPGVEERLAAITELPRLTLCYTPAQEREHLRLDTAIRHDVRTLVWTFTNDGAPMGDALDPSTEVGQVVEALLGRYDVRPATDADLATPCAVAPAAIETTPPGEADLSEEEAMRAIDELPEVVRERLETEEARIHFLRAGRAFFGGNRATLRHFGAIELVTALPGRVHMHRTAGERLAAAAAWVRAQGEEPPSTTVGFSLRGTPDPDYEFRTGSMHALGYAVDYQATANPHIQSRATATLIEMVTGEENYAQLDMSREQRRGHIQAMGEDRCAITPEQQELLERLLAECERLQAASRELQDSLGPNRDAFLEARMRYFDARAAGDEETMQGVLAEIPVLLRPWFDLLAEREREHGATLERARTLGLDPLALPDEETRRRVPDRLERIARRVEERRTAAAELETSAGASLVEWETELGIAPAGTPADRLEVVRSTAESLREDRSRDRDVRSRLRDIARAARRLAEDLGELDDDSRAYAEDLIELLPLTRGLIDDAATTPERLDAIAASAAPHEEIEAILDELAALAPLTELRARLSDPEYLFGEERVRDGVRAPRDRAGDPSVAQLVERGFFNMQEGFSPLFVAAVVRHGFDVGMAWRDEATDSMHIELAVSAPA